MTCNVSAVRARSRRACIPRAGTTILRQSHTLLIKIAEALAIVLGVRPILRLLPRYDRIGSRPMVGVQAPSRVELPVLYRGDSLPPQVTATNREHRGRTFAEHYVTAGLLAKSADGGLSLHLNRRLPILVATHIGYRLTDDGERYAAYHSPLISFSTEAAAAWHFLDRTSSKRFEPCALEDATHFMWKMEGASVEEIGPGHYRLRYLASTKNVDRFRSNLVEAVQQGDLGKLDKALAAQIVHGYVQQDNTMHTADVIDAVRYLDAVDATAGVDDELLKRARIFADRWSEWLVYPMDEPPDLRGYSARLSLNEYLDLHLFARETTGA